ncbi:COX15/CtaA family protein [Croceicoccus naphthovorans]|uniref:Heme A synthase n=1 Tax=Croceicoccus naphthovorans TaxID=1348774 RepID=A0A0G3XMQ1_9SPHN|nr:COX15/CtaA family protein [Croceicoccus naphthovorans]AKM11926.1 heme A synthase [Croceicoccus naphthovorans]MBB3989967.1 cytochrome c oxidase assembly protein subunit 15 [Croceicoccus naphthovorans]
MKTASLYAPDSVRYGSERPLALSRWLMIVAALVILIVAVGGITRLTESGLSITEWKPVTGALPPLNEAQWQAEFDAYKQIPEYIEVNGPAGMTLADYKFIYFWEWFHRLLGRLIGVAFALPLAWFWVRRAIPAGYKPRLLALLALGGLQGAFGWLMVRSGTGPDAIPAMRTDVSHYWLSVHLMTALFTLGGLVWTALDLRNWARSDPHSRLTGFSVGVLVILAIQLLYGGWMAGLDAGYVAGGGFWNSWPMMQGSFFPDGIDWALGAVHAMTADPFLVHFIHRWWAWVAVAALIVMARHVRAKDRRASIAIHATFGTQILLGIATVWTGLALWVAVAHQVVGALVLVAAVWGAHLLGYRDRMPGSALK